MLNSDVLLDLLSDPEDGGDILPETSVDFQQTRHLSDEVRVTSGVPQGGELGPLLFLAYVYDIWRDVDSNIRLFACDLIIYRKILDSSDIGKLQTDLNRLGEWAIEN
jgi:hypothetical protein